MLFLPRSACSMGDPEERRSLPPVEGDESPGSGVSRRRCAKVMLISRRTDNWS